MNPIDFTQANRTFTKPAGMDDEECSPLRVHDDGSQLVSCWQPTDAERAAIAAGAPVWLSVSGRGHPPVLVWADGAQPDRGVAGLEPERERDGARADRDDLRERVRALEEGLREALDGSTDGPACCSSPWCGQDADHDGECDCDLIEWWSEREALRALLAPTKGTT